MKFKHHGVSNAAKKNAVADFRPFGLSKNAVEIFFKKNFFFGIFINYNRLLYMLFLRILSLEKKIKCFFSFTSQVIFALTSFEFICNIDHRFLTLEVNFQRLNTIIWSAVAKSNRVKKKIIFVFFQQTFLIYTLIVHTCVEKKNLFFMSFCSSFDNRQRSIKP